MEHEITPAEQPDASPGRLCDLAVQALAIAVNVGRSDGDRLQAALGDVDWPYGVEVDTVTGSDNPIQVRFWLDYADTNLSYVVEFPAGTATLYRGGEVVYDEDWDDTLPAALWVSRARLALKLWRRSHLHCDLPSSASYLAQELNMPTLLDMSDKGTRVAFGIKANRAMRDGEGVKTVVVSFPAGKVSYLATSRPF